MTGMGIHLLDAFSFLVGPMARVSALSTRRILPFELGDTTQAMVWLSNNGATGNDRDIVEGSGLRVALRGVRLGDVGGVAVRNQSHDLSPATADLRHSTCRKPITSASILDSFVSPERSEPAKFEYPTTPGSCTRSRCSRRCSTLAERNGAWRDIA